VPLPRGWASSARPNVLFADDQRADTIAAWGNPHIKTPHLDRLTRAGFSFRNNYCFGLAADPHEMQNLAEDPAHVAEVARLTTLMKGWQKTVGDTQPLSVEEPRPKEVRFDDFIRSPDRGQPDWIVEKYFKKP
jgi:hypothetical protein